VPHPRKVEDVERQLEGVSKALKEREKKSVIHLTILERKVSRICCLVDKVPQLRKWFKRSTRRKEMSKK